MILRYRILSFLLFTVYMLTGQESNANAKSPEKLLDLVSFSNKNLNYSMTSTWKDSIITLCMEVEKEAWKSKDYNSAFWAAQIGVNAACLSGETGRAIVQAREMYDKAKELKSQLGKALALQAIGDTYMHTGLYILAAETFEEAEAELMKSDDVLIRLRLVIQQVHNYLKLDDVEKATKYLNIAEELLTTSDIAEKDLHLYIQTYHAMLAIKMGDEETARKYLENLTKSQYQDLYDIGLFLDLSVNYYIFTKEYDKALIYYDSLLIVSGNKGNLYEYKNTLQSKGEVLAKMGEAQEACLLYQQVRNLNQSLNTDRFVGAMDSIRSNYIADRMDLENAEAYSRLLIRIFCFSIIILIIVAALIAVIKKSNRTLNASRVKLAEASERARYSILSKSMFLSNMTHEIRTPLSAIVGFSEILSSEDEIKIDAETRQMCGESIRRNAQLLRKLISDVMEMTEQDESNMSFTLERCEVVALCRHVIETVQRVKRTSAEISFKTSLPEMVLYTDNARLQQVLINLLINATKFTPEGSITLILEVDEEKKEAVFIVEDTGCGIPLEKQPAMFSRFEKLHEGIQGSGIGLSICHFIVEKLKGRIWIDPDYTVGARFVFTHPLEDKKSKL